MSTNFSGLFGTLLRRRNVFISYHHANDQGYYGALSGILTDVYGCIADNSLERSVDSDDAEYVMRRIRENHVTGTSCTLVLCGSDTPWRKYVDWEIKATLDKVHGLVAIPLPTVTIRDGLALVPDRLHDNIASGYAQWVSWDDVLRGATTMKAIVEAAIATPARLIDNSRPMRARNG